MEQTESLIDILTYKLSGTIKTPLLTEYNNRLREIGNILSWEKSNYRVLLDYKAVIEALLAMSLFYRYMLGHIQGATSFYKTVNSKNGSEKECAIRIAKFVLDKEQQRYLLATVMAFNEIQVKYQIHPTFYEFSETCQFLKNCKDLLYLREYEEQDDDTI